MLNIIADTIDVLLPKNIITFLYIFTPTIKTCMKEINNPHFDVENCFLFGS